MKSKATPKNTGTKRQLRGRDPSGGSKRVPPVNGTRTLAEAGNGGPEIGGSAKGPPKGQKAGSNGKPAFAPPTLAEAGDGGPAIGGSCQAPPNGDVPPPAPRVEVVPGRTPEEVAEREG